MKTHIAFSMFHICTWYKSLLLSKGRKPEAIKVLTLACKFNKKPPPSFEQLDFSIDDNDVQKGTIKGIIFLNIYNNYSMYFSEYLFFD